MAFINKDLNFEKTSIAYKNTGLLSIIKRFLKDFLKGNIISVFFAILFMVGTGLATASTAYLIKPMANNVIADTADTGLTKVYYVGFGFMIIFVIKGICTYFSGFILNTVSLKRAFKMQKQLHNKLLNQDISYYSGTSSGRSVQLVSMSGMDGLANFFNIIFGAVRNFITVASLIVYMVYESIYYFMFACVLLMLFYIPFKFINKVVKNTVNKQIGISFNFSNKIMDFLRLFPLVKSYNLEKHQFNEVTNVAQSLLKLKLSVSRKSNLLSPLMEMVGGFLIGGVVLFVGIQSVKNSADIGQVFSMVTAVLLIYQPAKMMLNSMLSASVASIPVRRYYSLIDAPFSLEEDKNAKDIKQNDFDINIENVSFFYGNNRVLNNVSIDLPKGKKVALVGESGAGKSTIVRLIMKFIEADSGKVFIGKDEISTIATASLRDKIGFVGQDIGLFNTTIYENIAIGNKNATKEEVIKAAKQAYADDFIKNLENGYDTAIIENGANLSGGQRQRIAIARAILKNAPVFIFDEPTSALDNESEIKIEKAIFELTKDKTMLTVAHRLSTIQGADIIYAMKDGSVVEQGSHEDLIAQKGYYFELYNMQFSKSDENKRNN